MKQNSTVDDPENRSNTPTKRICLSSLWSLLDDIQQSRLSIKPEDIQTLQKLANKPGNFDNFCEVSDTPKSSLQVLADVLLKADEPCQRLMMKQMPDSELLLPILNHVFAKPVASTLPLLGLILQQTDSFNFSIMSHLVSADSEVFQQVIEQRSKKLLISIVRILEAQPNLKKQLNLSGLFAQTARGTSEVDMLILHLQMLIVPERFSGESSEQKSARMQLVDALILNKHCEKKTKENCMQQLKLRVEADSMCFDEEAPIKLVINDGIVGTSYLQTKAASLMQQIETEPHGHFAICGPQACGKMSFVKYAMQLYSKKYHQQQQMIVVTCEETFDTKNLVGTYVCSETGDFVFKKGPLTVAAEQGLWLVLKNIEDTPSDLLSFLLPLVQQNRLQVTSTFTIVPKLGFRMFCLSKSRTAQEIQPLLSCLHSTELETLYKPGYPGRVDLSDILLTKFPSLFIPICSYSIHQLVQAAIENIHLQMQTMKLNLLDYKVQSVTDLFSLYKRLHLAFNSQDLIHMSQAIRQHIIEEISDVYLGYMYDTVVKKRAISNMVREVFNHDQAESTLDSQLISEYITEQGREHGISNEQCFFGRAMLHRGVQTESDQESRISRFVYTGATVRFLEQIATAVNADEPVLLVGETGTGKTTVVQELASMLGRKLHVFNMNQNTDSADLLGGFKPVDLKYLLTPVYARFREVFCGQLNPNTDNNKKYLELLQKCFEQNKVHDFIKCLQHGMKSVKTKTDAVTALEQQIRDLQKRAQKLESGGGFIFQFVEGTLIKSIQNGDWILLDEINLAPDNVLNRLATIILGNNIMLNERADIVETKKHADFRVFMCMNPPYTSAGKKQLPYALRSRLCELYVPELDNQEDLWQIIDRNTKSNAGLQANNYISEGQKRLILEFYTQIKIQVSKQTKRGNIGLRNLCRALYFIKSAISLNYPTVKAIYDSLFTCFASHLDDQLQTFVRSLILKLFEIKSLPTLQTTAKGQNQTSYTCIEDCIVRLGNHKPEQFDSKDFIITKTFKSLLRQLASVVSVSSFAIILEGPTSAGKTSCVQYLAAVTHNKVIRINNHMHTDVQEYLGSYVPDSGTGKLVFQEGVLVEAVRKGYWVILDELNLAPSEVLEALNRLLDDNRELHIVETQKVVKAHPNFRIFATQNPTEGYGGRKELSEAFKNRFVLIRVSDVPTDELQEILIKKCALPASRASLMVKVMENLQIFRSQSNLFSGKNSIITVRDLLKWAGRINQSSDDSHVTAENIALEGFLLLGERSRNAADKTFIRETIEKVFGVKVEVEKFYAEYFEKHLRNVFQNVPAELNLPKISQSQQLKRIAVLVAKCLKNREPVLLVGETGCGKTTLCQVFASEVTKQPLFQINCHQNTETSDFIGCMRTRKNLQKSQDDLHHLVSSLEQALNPEDHNSISGLSLKKRAHKILNLLKTDQSSESKSQQAEISRLLDDLNCVFEWHDGILVESMQQGGLLLIDEISLANDSVLERLNSVFEEGRTLVLTEKSSQEAVKIKAHQAFNMVATMNPSGDFGKKELSPALRNRMTEIWVESYFQQRELLELFAQNRGELVAIDSLTDIDLFLIVKDLSEGLPIQVPLGIFNMVGYLTYVMTERYFALHRKAMSIRDILNIVNFIRLSKLEIAEAFKHAIELVIIDGVCLGIDVAGQQETQAILRDCRSFLERILSVLFNHSLVVEDGFFINTNETIGVNPFMMKKLKPQQTVSKFAFQATTTKSNLMKLLRAFSLNKPVLIEGPPGVGKTALVENLALETGRTLVRVNLSEQTDMMDLLGSEYPVARSHGNEHHDEDDIQFRWSDGVLLQAIKEGHWLLIDEMNLAQQSILEGLNAILDHRRTVYIPELNKEFTCHADFFVFACQNPSQSSGSTTGRKTLPKSFLNRFIKIYLDDLTTSDFELILAHIAGDMFASNSDVKKLLIVTQQIQANQSNQASINMRDLSRFLKMLRTFKSNEESQSQSILQALHSCYFMKHPEQTTASVELACKSGLIEEGHRLKTPLVRVQDNGVMFAGLTTTKVSSNAPKSQDKSTFKQFIEMKGVNAAKLQTLCDCLAMNIPVLITTDDPPRMIRTLSFIASVAGQEMSRILLSERSDTTQLLGCFEQTSTDLSSMVQLLQAYKTQPDLTQMILELESVLNIHGTQHDHDHSNLKMVEQIIRQHAEAFGDDLQVLLNKLNDIKHSSSRFEWVDSVLVHLIEQGGWAIFENANLCNPSILDRLNPLLEEGNYQMSINEQGLVNGEQIRNVKAHVDFRSVFVMAERTLIEQGKDVSRALRNRCQELWINFADEENNKWSDEHVSATELRAGSSAWQIVQLQADHDLVPIDLCVGKIDPPKLGKRTRDYDYQSMRLETQASVRVEQAIAYVCLLFEFLSDAGQISELQFSKMWTKLDSSNLDLKQAHDLLKNVMQECNYRGFDLYVYYMITQSRATLKSNLDNQIVDSNISTVLKTLIKNISYNQRDLLLLLRQLLTSQLRQSIFNPFALYQLSHIELDNRTRDILVRFIDSELAFLVSCDSINTLRYLEAMRPNNLSVQQIKSCFKDQALRSLILDDQTLFIYKVPRSELATYQHTSRVSLSLAQLKRNATVLLLDKDKELLSEQKMLESLEQVPDQNQLLETPNLMIIPTGAQSIVMSQSYLYPSLCFLKDWKWLQSSDKVETKHIRQTKIPVVASHSTSVTSVLARKISLTTLAQGNQNFNFAQQTISAILQDEQSVSLRDLPSYYACATSLLYKLKNAQQGNIDNEFKSIFASLVQSKLPQDRAPSRLAHVLCTRVEDLLGQSTSEKAGDVAVLAKQAVTTIDQSFALLDTINTVQTLQALYILPLEIQRQSQLADLAALECQSKHDFFSYHIRDKQEATLLIAPQQINWQAINAHLSRLQTLATDNGDAELRELTQKQLKPLLSFVNALLQEVHNVQALLDQDDTRISVSCQTIAQLLLKGVEHYFPLFNHILQDLFTTVCALEESVRTYKLLTNWLCKDSNLAQSLINLRTNSQLPLFEHQSKVCKHSQQKDLFERQLLWSVRFNRSAERRDQQVMSQAFDYFVRREILRKMKEEEKDPDEQVFFVPFKVKGQIPEVVGKAMDEWTKEDVAKMEAEAEKAIEQQFPSYYDDVQRNFFAAEYDRDGQPPKSSLTFKEITVEHVLQEILDVSELSKGQVLRERLELAAMAMEHDQIEQVKREMSMHALNDPMMRTEQQLTWSEDACCYLQHQLEQTAKLKQLMNISDLQMTSTYNFYHSPFPEEVKLCLQPLQAVLMRLRDIVVRDGYESPILNESMFLANYMLTCFNAETTPLMKLLMSIEFLLTKLEEWENTYASKRLNSIETEINTLKQIVIRLRKIQILSWRNLLNWKKEQFVKEDFMNYVRLAHTLERQVFDAKLYASKKGEQSVELKMFELLDLFMRDSTLGIYAGRLNLIKFLIAHFEHKQSKNMSEQAKTRLGKLINSLDFVYNYYAQFQAKLQSTVDRLDANAREKVKTLIDVRKWTVQKFSIIKNNIDKTHRQLYKACKEEEEALLQNVQSLVIASSRKKYAINDQMISLDPELKVEPLQSLPKCELPTEILQQFAFVKQLQFLEEHRIRAVWPTAQPFEDAMVGFFERLADVRAVNKKHIQKRAYYDLLRYFKNQGVRSTQSEDFQQLLIDARQSTGTYFYKAYETFLMLQSSSQVDGNNDFQNAEIRRVQGFSQNLIFKVLNLNQNVQQMVEKVNKLQKAFTISFAAGQNLAYDNFGLVSAKTAYTKAQTLTRQVVDKLSIQILQAEPQRQQKLKVLSSAIQSALKNVPTHPLDTDFAPRLHEFLESTKSLLTAYMLDTNSTPRDRMICSSTIQEFSSVQLVHVEPVSDPLLNKKLSKCEQEIKLIYQDLVRSLAEDPKDAGTRKSSLENDTTNPTVVDHNERYEFTMEQHGAFTKRLNEEVFGCRLQRLIATVNKLYECRIATSGEQLKYTTALLVQLCSCLSFVVENQRQVLQKMTKFSYLTQRVFLYLIYQGFCGIDEPDDPEENPPSDLEQEDGCGLGDGKGGAQNITDQIEHEEQLEGLKDYESDQEQQEQEEVSHEEGENDFEMKNDFDGAMDDERDEEQKHNENDEEDEIDDVDDMLDNQLWDKNMEDMEKKEQEEMEQEKEKENREVDLGEKDIAPENQVDNKQQDVAEGDFDQREKDSQEGPEQDQDQEMAESEGGERHESEAERDEEESEQQEVPLDKDSIKAEPEEEFSEDGVSESELQSDAEQNSEPSLEGDDGEEGSIQEEQSAVDAEDELDVKPECNQAVLEDDQIQAKEEAKKDDKKPNTQANLKKQEAANREKSDAQKQATDNQSSSQVDPFGQDMLYQLTQQLQQRQREKQSQQQKAPEQSEAKKTVDQPKLTEQQAQEQEEPMADDGEAMEYEQDDNAQDLQGRLCTDQVQENQAVDEEMKDESEQGFDSVEQMIEERNQRAEMTGAQIKQAEPAKADAGLKQKDEEMQELEESKEELKDLIDEYMQYLSIKEELTMQVDDRQQPDTAKGSNFTQDLAPFDLLEQKQSIREMFANWMQNSELHRTSLELLAKFKNQTQHVSAMLCEQLRIILEPQLSQNLQGDYKTGKRLNMKKVISFIASHYRNDKIWLRRTMPSKRDYKILIAIDDTLSMKENNLGFFSLEAMIALTEALNKLEVGKVAVARIRDRLDLLHGFDDTYTAERAGFIVSQFEFAHCGTTSADHAMANFVCDANKLLDMQNHGGSAITCPFVIVLSDGRFNKENVRRYIREAKEKRYLFIFIVLDKPKTLESGKSESTIMSLRSAIKGEQGMKLVPYLKDFPFDYYCIVQDTQQLPNSLGTILVQWYQMVAASTQAK